MPNTLLRTVDSSHQLGRREARCLELFGDRCGIADQHDQERLPVVEPGAGEGIDRGQVDVLETMTPVSFSSFRSRLDKASGFQSVQFRELELALGKRDPRLLAQFRSEPAIHGRLLDRVGKPTLYDSFVRHLALRGYAIPDELLQRDFREPIPQSAVLRATLVGIYRDDPAATAVCERLVDLDEGLQEWRYRHVKMVERTIGALPGTGGSSGAAYLRTTLFTPLFQDLWAIRAEL